MEKEFDVIVFATGYKSIANEWLKVYVIGGCYGERATHVSHRWADAINNKNRWIDILHVFFHILDFFL
jgi:hypothetical protein